MRPQTIRGSTVLRVTTSKLSHHPEPLIFTSHAFCPRNGVTRGCHARSLQRVVCNIGHKCSVTLRTAQGYPRRVSSHPTHPAAVLLAQAAFWNTGGKESIEDISVTQSRPRGRCGGQSHLSPVTGALPKDAYQGKMSTARKTTC